MWSTNYFITKCTYRESKSTVWLKSVTFFHNMNKIIEIAVYKFNLLRSVLPDEKLSYIQCVAKFHKQILTDDSMHEEDEKLHYNMGSPTPSIHFFNKKKIIYLNIFNSVQFKNIFLIIFFNKLIRKIMSNCLHKF